MAKEKRATWFKLFLRHKSVFDIVTDEEAGKAIKAVFQYFETGEVADIEMNRQVSMLFAALKVDVDEAIADYERRVRNGIKSQNKNREAQLSNTEHN